MWRPRYSGPGQTGQCRCGHSADDHHGSIVMNADYFAQTGEGRVPGGCEFYGCNEGEGLDDEWRPHCFDYVDAGDVSEECVDVLSVPRQVQPE
jgi:hypothetical protein